MAVYANTDLASITIPIEWDHEVLQARYATGVIWPKVLNRSEVVKGQGSQITIPIKGRLTAGTVTAGTGAFVPQAVAPTTANIVLNTWVQVAVEITDQAKAQSFWDPTSDFPKDAGAAMSVRYDQDLAALYSTLTGLTAVGNEATPEAFDDGAARAAILRLANANVPKNNLSFFLPPVAWYAGWLAKVELTAAYATGESKSAMTTGLRTPILGVPGYESNLLTTVGTAIKGLLLHKEAFGVGMQLNNETKMADRTSALLLSKVAVMSSLYGVLTVRNDHGVVINVRNS